MKCPKYIKDALFKRARLAALFTIHDMTIYEFLEKHDIEVESYDILGGCEAYVNPFDSAKRILAAIEAKGEDND